MGQIFSFSAGTQLYAQHFKLVNEMRRQSRRELRNFCEAIEKAVLPRFASRPFERKYYGSSRCWWFKSRSGKMLCASVFTKDQAIVDPGTLTIWIEYEFEGAAYKLQEFFDLIQDRLPLDSQPQIDRKYITVTTAVVHSNPVDSVLEVVTTVLQALSELTLE